MSKPLSNIISSWMIFLTLFLAGFFIYEEEIVRWLYPESVEADSLTQAPVRLEKNALVLPEEIMLDVPFSSQAPLGSWQQPWQDACEETSALMAVAWARRFEFTPAIAAEEILKQVEFENRAFGQHRDTNVDLTSRLFKDFYRYENIEVRYDNISVESIKNELASGNLVIVPLAGEILARENPYFVSPPHYHMAVIRGFDDRSKEFIVNEPGTKHGNGFRYSYAILMEAIHDWTGLASTVLLGKKAMIVVEPVVPAGLRQRGI